MSARVPFRRLLAAESTRRLALRPRTFAPAFQPAAGAQQHFSVSSRRREIVPQPAVGQPSRRFKEFELDNRVVIITGGAGGLGLTLAEGVVEAGGHAYCLDWQEKPPQALLDTQERCKESKWLGSLHYERVDVSDADNLDKVVGQIADKHSRLDGLIAAAGVQNVTPALDYPPHKITEMMDINFKGVMLSAVSCARQMIKHKTPGNMVLVGSMSGLIANKGFTAAVYNSSKGAVIQLGRSLSMEWGKIVDGKPIRVNVLCPGNIMTPMVRKNFEDDPELRALWEKENMLGRISEPHEFRGAAVFLLSDASTFMTGAHLVVDGGYTAW